MVCAVLWRVLCNEYRQFVRRRTWRKVPHTSAVYCCYLLSFICGYHEYGTESILKILLAGSVKAQIGASNIHLNWASSLALWVLGASYILFSIPVAYVLGEKLGHKWAIVLGQVMMYLYGLCGGFACSFDIGCLNGSSGEQIYWFTLAPFTFGFVLMNVNFIQLALEQVDNISSSAKTSFINWLWFFFFLGRGFTVMTTSTILFWGVPVYAFLIKTALAVSALSLLIWVPFKRVVRRGASISMPFASIWRVCREAWKQCSCKKRHEHTPRYNQRRYPPDYRPNSFERSSEDFGGPLTIEEVRNVQKFILISGMLFSFVGILIIYSLVYSAYSIEIGKMEIPKMLLNSVRSNTTSYTFPNVEYNELSIPVSWFSVIGDLTTVISIAVLDLLLYTRFTDQLNIHRRIMLGTVFGFLTSLSSVVTESVRYGFSQQNGTVLINGLIALRNSPLELTQGTENVSMFTCIPQYVLYGIMTAFIIPATNELVGISAPVELRPLLFGVYFTIMGVSMTLGGLIMFMQMAPTSLWCFFCFVQPKTGLMTFVITTMITLVLFLLYLFLSWLYKKLELVIEPRPNEDIHPHFGRHGYEFGPTNED